jgi:hypothetical protein
LEEHGNNGWRRRGDGVPDWLLGPLGAVLVVLILGTLALAFVMDWRRRKRGTRRKADKDPPEKGGKNGKES